MDINKEREAHEKHLFSQGVDFKYLPNIQYNEQKNVYELIEWSEEYSEALNEINSSWCTWQATKAQAVPKGFVVVPVCEYCGGYGEVGCQFEGTFTCPECNGDRVDLKAMIEAQEQK